MTERRRLTEEDFDNHPILDEVMIGIAKIQTEDPEKFLTNYMSSIVYGDDQEKRVLVSAFKLVPLRDRVNIIQYAIKNKFTKLVPKLSNLSPMFGIDEFEEVRLDVVQMEDPTFLQALTKIQQSVERRRAKNN
jgi:hypothetical protein